MDAQAVLALLPPQTDEPDEANVKRKRREHGKRKWMHSVRESRLAKRMRAQALHFNNSGRARTFHHQMPIVRMGKSVAPAPPRGPGQYRTSTPEYICKMAFNPPEAPLRVVAKEHGGSASHASGCSMVVADLVVKRQSDLSKKRRAASGQGQQYDFYITNNMFDETQLRVAGFGKGTKRRRVLAASGQVTWKAPQSRVQDQRVIREPTVMKRYTAATCAAVVGRPDDPCGLSPHADVRPLARFYGSLMATDQHSVNVLTSKWVVQQQRAAGENSSIHAVCFCTQHKTGAVVEAVTKFLGLLSPSFCISSCLSCGDLADDIETNIRAILEEVLVVSDPAEMCYTEEEKRNVEFAKELMEQCYVCDAAQDQDCDEVEASIAVRRRRTKAKELLDFFPLWGTTERVEHPCPPGCCGVMAKADRAVSLDRASALIKCILAPSITTPAANKYTKVDPVVRKVALMTNFLGLLRRAVAKKLGRRDASGDVDDSEVLDWEAAIGMPRDPMQHHKNLGKVKLNKAFRFLQQSASKYLPLVWLVVCSCVMVVHYKLFQQGTWYGQRHGTRCDIFDFCGPTHLNPVAHALSALAAMLLDPSGSGAQHLSLLFLKFGRDHGGWPSRVLAALQISLVLAFCCLWRKIFYYFDSYPWRLARAFDDRCTREEQRAVLQKGLTEVSDCCVDPGVLEVLRALTTNPDDYFGTVLGDFLKTFFERVVVTSTQVELQFARLSIWTAGGGRGPRLGLPSIAARATTTEFENSVKRWRESLQCPPSRGNTRPEWTKHITPGSKKNYLHLYMEDFVQELRTAGDSEVADVRGNMGPLARRASKEFKELPATKQSEYKRNARCSRAVALASPSPLATALAPQADRVEGPLGLASSGIFPMRPSAVAAHLDGQRFVDVVKRWQRTHSSKVEPSPTFPDTIEAKDVCTGGFCKKPLFHDVAGSEKLREPPALLLEHIRLVLRFSTRPVCSDPTILLMFLSGESRLFFLVGRSQHLDQHQFTAEFLSMVHSGDPDSGADFALPMLLRFAPGRMVLGRRWPDICCERSAVARLTAIAERWEISVLTCRVPSISERLATDAECWTLDAARARNAEYLAQQASMSAFRAALGARRAKAKASSSRRASSSKGGGVPRAAAGAGGGAAVSPPSSSDESSSHSDDSAEEYWRSIVASLRDKSKPKPAPRPLARTEAEPSTKVATPATIETPFPAAPGAPRIVVAPAAGEGRMPHVEHGARVVEKIGAAVISEVRLRGDVVAYSITCGRHTNAADPPHTECKKQLPIGTPPLPAHEVIRRLKIWHIIGAHDASWDVNTARSQHLAEGGRRLNIYASDSEGWQDFTDADIDLMVEQRH